MYDVIVVGARCAGSPLAMLLARQGHRVLVVDQATFPSDTISTHYIQPKGLTLLKKWGLLDRMVATGVPPVRLLNFSYTDIALSGFGDPMDGIAELYCPRRTVLDALLVDAAREAGAEVIEGFTVSRLLVDDGTVVGVEGADGTQFRATMVVGADGKESTVARLADADIYVRYPASCFVYYSYWSGLDWEMNHRTGFDRAQFAAWPTNDGLTLVAAMTVKDRFADFRSDVEGNFAGIVRSIDPVLGEKLGDGRREERFYPMRYPDNFYRRSSGPGWALVGDAGYHKDPFTGWGISDAFKQADLLAEKLHEALSGNRPVREATDEYVRIRDEESAGTFRLTCGLAELQLNPYLDSVLRAAAQSPAYQRKFFNMIAGAFPGEEFFHPDNLAALYDEVGTPPGARILSPAGAPA